MLAAKLKDLIARHPLYRDVNEVEIAVISRAVDKTFDALLSSLPEDVRVDAE